MSRGPLGRALIEMVSRERYMCSDGIARHVVLTRPVVNTTFRIEPEPWRPDPTPDGRPR